MRNIILKAGILMLPVLLAGFSQKNAIMSTETTDKIQKTEVVKEILHDDGTFPNNEELPLIIYKKAIDFSSNDPASDVEKVFHENNWGQSWRNGIFSYHHYHSTAHEALGVYSGWVNVQLGGDNGIKVKAEKGDVIILPAGVAHKNLDASSDFKVVGAYPPGQSYDMNYGKEGERPQADENIRQVPLPKTDPVFGEKEGIVNYWK